MAGHIRKRYDSSWIVTVELGRDPITGKRLRKQRSIKGTRKDAERLLRRLELELEQGSIGPSSRQMTFAEVASEWLQHLHAQGRAIRTREIYEACLRRILPAIGHISLDKLQTIHVQRFLDSLQNDGARLDGRPGGLSAKSIRHHHGTISAALSFAQRMGWISRNPAEHVTLPSRQQAAEPTILDRDQLATLLRALEGTRWFPLFYVVAHTGLRVGEVCGLWWDDIDWREPAIIVRRSLTRTATKHVLDAVKGREQRTVYLRDEDVEVLRAHRSKQEIEIKMAGGRWPHPEHIFTTPNGELLHTTVPNQILKKWCRKLGLPVITMHGLRHMHGSHLLAYEGWDLAAVSERLGHASVAFTARVYTHVIPGMQKHYIKRGKN